MKNTLLRADAQPPELQAVLLALADCEGMTSDSVKRVRALVAGAEALTEIELYDHLFKGIPDDAITGLRNRLEMRLGHLAKLLECIVIEVEQSAGYVGDRTHDCGVPTEIDREEDRLAIGRRVRAEVEKAEAAAARRGSPVEQDS